MNAVDAGIQMFHAGYLTQYIDNELYFVPFGDGTLEINPAISLCHVSLLNGRVHLYLIESDFSLIFNVNSILDPL